MIRITYPPFLLAVASLLSSLHQLKEENGDLEYSVDRMVQRRDHLLAVRARLLALSSISVGGQNAAGGGSAAASSNTTPDRQQSNGPSPYRERGAAAAAAGGTSSATVSPISIRRSGGSEIISPQLPSPRGAVVGGRPPSRDHQPHLPAPPPQPAASSASLVSPRDIRGQQLPSPRNEHHRVVSPRHPPGHPVENGLDYHQQHHSGPPGPHPPPPPPPSSHHHGHGHPGVHPPPHPPVSHAHPSHPSVAAAAAASSHHAAMVMHQQQMAAAAAAAAAGRLPPPPQPPGPPHSGDRVRQSHCSPGARVVPRK